MRYLVLTLLLFVPGAAYAQGTVIPDGLDCDNLTADQLIYRGYCQDAADTGHDSFEEIVREHKESLGALEKVIALQEKAWAKVENGEFDAGLDLFDEALTLNENGNRGWLSKDYQRSNIKSIIEAVEYLKATAPGDADRNGLSYGYWQGQGLADYLAEKKEQKQQQNRAAAAARASAAEAATSRTENARWYRIKYECYASDAKGLDILQVVRDSGPDFVEIEIHLRFVDLHPKYHRNVLLRTWVGLDGSFDMKPWIALMGAGENNGAEWVSPPIRIPRTWSFDGGNGPYTATWDDDRQRYRLSNWQDEKPFDRWAEQELFGVRIECYQHQVDPRDWPRIVRM